MVVYVWGLGADGKVLPASFFTRKTNKQDRNLCQMINGLIPSLSFSTLWERRMRDFKRCRILKQKHITRITFANNRCITTMRVKFLTEKLLFFLFCTLIRRIPQCCRRVFSPAVLVSKYGNHFSWMTFSTIFFSLSRRRLK